MQDSANSTTWGFLSPSHNRNSNLDIYTENNDELMSPWVSRIQKLDEIHGRTVYINDDLRNWQTKFEGNYIKTTKYNCITFLPLSILYQFKWVANVYFVAICILNLIPGLGAVTPWSSITPVLFVFGVSMIKELVEDLRWFKRDWQGKPS